MPFELKFTDEAKDQLSALKNDSSKQVIYKALGKALGYLEANPRYSSLNTHQFQSRQGRNGEKVWEAYAQNNTPGAYRIFFHYGPGASVITVFAVTPHP